jgi:hypothetical protein
MTVKVLKKAAFLDSFNKKFHLEIKIVCRSKVELVLVLSFFNLFFIFSGSEFLDLSSVKTCISS